MAPTSDKRLQAQTQAHTKEGVGSTNSYLLSQSHHTKENASNNEPQTKKKELEILDFHESWLEEMELYKDKLYVQKHLAQQLLGSHNHDHTTTPQGCQQLDSNSIYSRLISKNLNAIMKPPNAASSFDPTTPSGNAKRRERGECNREQTADSKSRATVRGTMAMAAKVVSAAPLESKQIRNAAATVQLLLKRPRDEASATAKPSSRISKRLNHNHSQNSPEHGQNTAKSGNASSASPHSGSTSPTNTKLAPSAKIIVNKFHAQSSLLSSHQHDEKTKILTQNGLDKTAATASIYASHYLRQDKSNGGPLNGTRYSYGENGHSKGGSASKDAKSDEDDPCGAIDDVNNYTDSDDSDEEYTGSPFYLHEDGNDTHQSCHIRYHSDLPSTGTSENSEQDHSEYYQPKTILSPSLFPNVPPYLNFSSHAEKGPEMPAALHKVLKWKLSPVMPRIVKRVVLNSGFRIIKNTTDWMAIWERHMKSPGFRTIRSHQKYNHMPGSFRIGRKDSMWRSIYDNMKKFGSKEFGFMQKSYIMPDDLESLRKVWPKNASKLAKWIVKPPASARGTGIRIVNKWCQFPKDRPLVVQKYIERPLLINENKFDMRIYVIVTSINPLRIYMYKDGLARFASVKYSSELNSLDDRCMHLTNYSINKFSENYSKNEDFNACQGHKWTLQSLWSCLESRGVNTKRLWATLRNLVIKAIISGESGLNRMYRQNVNFRYNCFELFGFDVLLDESLIPWLLEINISPSLHSELPLDLHVKGPLIQAVLNTALYQVPPKLSEKLQKDILEELNLAGSLCHDKRIFTTCLTAEEVRKHNHYTNRSIEYREEYIEAILDHLLPDDVRCLIVAEDEYARSKPLERIFPTSDTHTYLKFVENPRYYNRLLDAWEHKYSHCRDQGIALLRKYCEDGYHLQVSEAALEKEPNVALTEIDLLHTRRDNDIAVASAVTIDSVTADDIASKASSPVSGVEVCTNETSNSSSPKTRHVLDPQF